MLCSGSGVEPQCWTRWEKAPAQRGQLIAGTGMQEEWAWMKACWETCVEVFGEGPEEGSTQLDVERRRGYPPALLPPDFWDSCLLTLQLKS